MSVSLFLVFALSLLAVGLLINGIYQIWSSNWGNSASLLKRRLAVMTGEISIDNRSFVKSRLLSDIPIFDELFKSSRLLLMLDAFLKQANSTTKVGGILTVIFVLFFTSLALMLYFRQSILLSLLFGFIPIFVFFMILERKRKKRIEKVESQLPDTLDLMARAMQAGHAFSSALLIVGTEGSDPIRGEFQITFDEINFGIPIVTALHNLTERVASRDMRFFVVAVLIQLETGGNLTEVMKSLATLIRERQRIVGNVRVLTAEGRLSAWILSLLPFGIGAFLSIINHEFISKLWTDPMGILMLQVSLALMGVGIWWMRRMVKFKI